SLELPGGFREAAGLRVLLALIHVPDELRILQGGRGLGVLRGRLQRLLVQADDLRVLLLLLQVDGGLHVAVVVRLGLVHHWRRRRRRLHLGRRGILHDRGRRGSRFHHGRRRRILHDRRWRRS